MLSLRFSMRALGKQGIYIKLVMIRKFSEVERNENKEVLGSLRRYR